MSAFLAIQNRPPDKKGVISNIVAKLARGTATELPCAITRLHPAMEGERYNRNPNVDRAPWLQYARSPRCRQREENPDRGGGSEILRRRKAYPATREAATAISRSTSLEPPIRPMGAKACSGEAVTWIVRESINRRRPSALRAATMASR
jgi:hypothetical protein